jgi:hypothetical protein
MFNRTLKTAAGILLLPLAIGTAKAFCVSVSEISLFSGSLRIVERGVLAYLIFHVMVMRPAYLYVLSHELVHVLATWLCGGKVVSFKVTPAGGNVVTSKSNIFIELSPYFVPFYSVLLGPVFFLLKATGNTPPFMSMVFLFFMGVTMAFHFVMTSEVLRMQQPDIIKSGIIFSMVLIFICNMVVIMGVFSPVFDSLSFVDFMRGSWERSSGLYRAIYAEILGLARRFGASI